MPEFSLKTRTVPAGEDLFKEGDAATEAYLIKKGYVSVWRIEQDQRVNLGTRGDGEIVGEMALIDEIPRSATVTAEEDLEVAMITQGELEDMLAHAPEVLTAILHQLLESLRSTNDLVAMYASRPPQE